MQSEFYNVALDRIRYSLVWEDSQTLFDALNINTKDHLLIITSAGCNVLNALLKNPATATAVDINPVQNKLLLLKKHIILHHDFETYQSLLGLEGKNAVSTAGKKLFKTLPANEKSYWSGFLNNHPDGLLTSGKLESYITGFYKTLEDDVQKKLQQLITFKDVKKQYDFFMEHLHNSSLRQDFITYFDDQNLSKGRHPNLFKYANESGGEAFYKRLVKQVSSVLVSSNFYFRFFFFGPQNIPEQLLPPCYQQQNFEPLKEAVSKLTIITSEAIDYLLSPEGKHINKASLSNIFEYTSVSEFKNACNSLYKNSNRQLKIVYWNLLHEQGHEEQAIDGLSVKILEDNTSQSCFYFKDVRILDSSILTSHQHKLIKQL